MYGLDILAAALLLTALMVSSTLNLALRMPSRVRLAAQFTEHRLNFEAFIAIRPRYLLATAVIRTVCVLSTLLMCLHHLEVSEGGGWTTGTTVAGLAALLLVLVFGVAIPNAWAKYTGDWLIVRMLPILAASRIISYPIIVSLEVFDPLIRRLAGVPLKDARAHADELEREILDAVTEGERHGAVDEEEKEMIESVIELTDKRVEEIMTPRTDVVAIPKAGTLEEILETIRTNGHSRIPVYDDTIDTILGVIYAKDLLRRPADAPFRLDSMMREPYFIPESKLVRDLLREFQARKLHIAIVLDEYGGTSGLVTIEDILEELVGEITDEYEPTPPEELIKIDEQTVEVDARMQIDDINDELDLALPEDEGYETIGGFVFSTMGRIPKVGESWTHENLGIKVIAAEPRRIIRLRLHVTPADDKNQTGDRPAGD